jgi:hypothetical protein
MRYADPSFVKAKALMSSYVSVIPQTLILLVFRLVVEFFPIRLQALMVSPNAASRFLQCDPPTSRSLSDLTTCTPKDTQSLTGVLTKNR